MVDRSSLVRARNLVAIGAVTVLSLVGCGKDGDSAKKSTTTTSTTTTTVATDTASTGETAATVPGDATDPSTTAMSEEQIAAAREAFDAFNESDDPCQFFTDSSLQNSTAFLQKENAAALGEEYLAVLRHEQSLMDGAAADAIGLFTDKLAAIFDAMAQNKNIDEASADFQTWLATDEAKAAQSDVMEFATNCGAVSSTG